MGNEDGGGGKEDDNVVSSSSSCWGEGTGGRRGWGQGSVVKLETRMVAGVGTSLSNVASSCRLVSLSSSWSISLSSSHPLSSSSSSFKLSLSSRRDVGPRVKPTIVV